jgi:hypothetical protein
LVWFVTGLQYCTGLIPEGPLRAVTSVSATPPGTYVIDTSRAPLSAAFSTLTADISLGTQSPSGGSGARTARFIPTAPGIGVRQLPQAGLSTTLGRSVDYSAAAAGGGRFTADVQAEIDLTPSLNLKASLLRNWAGLPDGATLSFTASLGVTESSSVTASGSVQKEWSAGTGVGVYPPAAPDYLPQAGKYCYGTFEVLLGSVPLVLTPCVEIGITLTATGRIGVTSSVSFLYGERATWTSARPGALALTALSKPRRRAAGSLVSAAARRWLAGLQRQARTLPIRRHRALHRRLDRA